MQTEYAFFLGRGERTEGPKCITADRVVERVTGDSRATLPHCPTPSVGSQGAIPASTSAGDRYLTDLVVPTDLTDLFDLADLTDLFTTTDAIEK